ncbi:MAG: hypothetical protein HFE75_09255 [Firmicutes bacterium]|jgi:hypothetical protein|nr:hypothetical protein [Bacillota bacterium]NBI63462.1 hypothetical protein [Clostridiales bacterium]
MEIAKTDTIIKTEGMEALISRLGYVDAERFIALLSKEPFDYTEWRQTGLEQDLDVVTLSQKAEAFSKNL